MLLLLLLFDLLKTIIKMKIIIVIMILRHICLLYVWVRHFHFWSPNDFLMFDCMLIHTCVCSLNWQKKWLTMIYARFVRLWLLLFECARAIREHLCAHIVLNVECARAISSKKLKWNEMINSNSIYLKCIACLGLYPVLFFFYFFFGIQHTFSKLIFLFQLQSLSFVRTILSLSISQHSIENVWNFYACVREYYV